MSSSGRFSSLPLPPDTSAPATARRHSREVLGKWQLRELIEPVALIVSELVTNAVRHGRPPVSLLLRRRRRDVRIEVQDAAPALSGPGATGEEAESGRGLDIVRAMSSSTGIDEVHDDGKVVWATVNGATREDRRG